MACKRCTALEGFTDITMSIDYPRVPIETGKMFNINIILTPSIAIGTMSLCIYIDNIFKESMPIEFSSFTPVIKTLSYEMPNKDIFINISLIEAGLIYDNCDIFQDLIIYYKAPPTPTRYNCTNGTCEGPAFNGTYDNLPACIAAPCKPPNTGFLGCNPTTKKCIKKTGITENMDGCETLGNTCCPADSINIMDTCVKKNTVMMVAGAAVLYMMFKK
jgi:hypothetical protein